MVDINFIRMFSVHTPVEGGKLGVYYSSLFTLPPRNERGESNFNASPTDVSPNEGTCPKGSSMIRPLIPEWPGGHPRLINPSFCYKLL